MQQRKAVLIAGMHRSGTSAVTRVLNLLGGSLASDLMPANEQNITGYWECARLTVLHDRLLASVGSRWDDWRSLPQDFCERALQTDTVADIRTLLRQEFKQCTIPIVKDPRVCRFVPLWADVLELMDFAPHVLIPLRNPLEVAQSLHKRDGFSMAKGFILWLRHVLDAERGSRGLPRAFVWYRDLLFHWEREADRISRELNLCWPGETQQVASKVDQFLQPELCHNRSDAPSGEGDPQVKGWIRRTCDAFYALSQNKDVASSQQQLDQISSALDDAEAVFAGFIAEEIEQAASDCAKKSEYFKRQLQLEREHTAQLEAEVNQLSLQLGLQQNQPGTFAQQHGENRARLLASHVFDEEWYLATYSDVRAAGADAATHYLNHGAIEGRDASAAFSTLAYLVENPECAATGQNPVLHYLDKAK